MELDGVGAIVTGGASGLGDATVRRLKNAGAIVLGEWIIFHGKRNEQRLRRLAQILSVLGGEIDGRREVLIRSR